MPNSIKIGGENHGFTVELTDIGAGIRSILPTGSNQPITRPAPPLQEMESGRQGGGFFTFGQFARAEGRKVLWNGKEYHLPWVVRNRDGEKNALHGAEPWLTFQVVHQDANSVSFRLPAHKLPADYPFPHHSELHVAVDGDTLTFAATVENVGSESQPANPAWHSFYNYHRDGQPIQLQANLSDCFHYAGDPAHLELPHATTAPIAVSEEANYLELRPLERNLDYSFRYDGYCEFGWPGMMFRAMSSRKHLQLWSVQWQASEAGICAIEQTAGPANGPWLAAKGIIPASELFVVEPGERKTHTVMIQRI